MSGSLSNPAYNIVDVDLRQPGECRQKGAGKGDEIKALTEDHSRSIGGISKKIMLLKQFLATLVRQRRSGSWPGTLW
jgi:hypothetical protein